MRLTQRRCGMAINGLPARMSFESQGTQRRCSGKGDVPANRKARSRVISVKFGIDTTVSCGNRSV
jgi:hypothetical protein